MPPRWCRRLLAIFAILVPQRDRDPWRLGWSENLEALWTLIERGEVAVPGGAALARFYWAALVSAWWLRFNRDSLQRWMRGPGLPLAAGALALALGGVVTRGFSKTRFLIYLARHWQPVAPRGLSYDPRGDQLFAYLFPIVLAVTTAVILVAVGCRMLQRRGARYWSYFVVKTLMLLGIASLVWIEGGAALRSVIPHNGLRLFFGGLLLVPAFVICAGWCALWSLADQRRRCPVCLHLLEMPVTMGSWSSVFEPATTEFLCADGHGALSRLEAEATADRWVALDGSWRSLFRRHSRKKDPILR